MFWSEIGQFCTAPSFATVHRKQTWKGKKTLVEKENEKVKESEIERQQAVTKCLLLRYQDFWRHIGDGRWVVVVHKQRADSQAITPAGLPGAA